MIWAALSLCLVLSFVLSGLESAILAVSHVRIRHNAGEPRPLFGARWLGRVFRHHERLLASVLLLNDVVTLFAFAIVTRELVSSFGAVGYLIAFAVSLPVYLFVFELVPKSLFERFPYRLLRLFVPVLWCVEVSLGSLLAAATPRRRPTDEPENHEAAPESAAEGIPPPAETPARLEFRSLTDIIARQGLIGPSETRLIGNILDFPTIEVSRIMIPLDRVVTVPLDLPARDVLALSRANEVDQLPVLASDGTLVGLVNALELLRHPDPRGQAVNFLRRIVRARPGDPARDVLVRLRAAGVELAAVGADDGPPLGIVSAEDIVSRLLHGN